MNAIQFRAPAGLLLAVLMPSLSAQQLIQPVSPPINPLPQSTLGTDASQLRQVTPAPAVRSDPSQRPASTAPIPDKGPANEPPSVTEPTQPLPAAPVPATVLDAQGKPVRGALQVAPNRIYDPATGRYHWTAPSGQQQKIID